MAPADRERIEAIQRRVDEASGEPWSWEDDSHGDCRKATLYSDRTMQRHGLNLLGRLEPDTATGVGRIKVPKRPLYTLTCGPVEHGKHV